MQYVKPFFSIYPSCRNTDGVIEVVEEEEEVTEVEEVEEDAYWCDKKWTRTIECQSWVSPEEQAAYDAKVAAY